jgi:hypothetical protein
MVSMVCTVILDSTILQLAEDFNLYVVLCTYSKLVAIVPPLF